MFQGFTQETVDFMWGIRFNNERSWFLEHKEDYQKHLLEPVKALGEDIYKGVQEMLPPEPLLLKVSRIYRDARRLHGRGPYKDHLWFCVRTGDKDWTGRPTFYFEIAPEYYSYGMGFWQAPAELMEAFRRDLQERPEKFGKLVRGFNRQEQFVLNGDSYARSRGEVDELLRPWFQKKSITLTHELPLDEKIFQPELAEEILTGFKSLVPFYKYFAALCASVERRPEE